MKDGATFVTYPDDKDRAWVPGELTRNPKIGLAAKVAYAAMRTMGASCFAKISTIAEEMGKVSLPTVRGAIAELEEWGWVIEAKKAGPRNTAIYIIMRNPRDPIPDCINVGGKIIDLKNISPEGKNLSAEGKKVSPIPPIDTTNLKPKEQEQEPGVLPLPPRKPGEDPNPVFPEKYLDSPGLQSFLQAYAAAYEEQYPFSWDRDGKAYKEMKKVTLSLETIQASVKNLFFEDSWLFQNRQRILFSDFARDFLKYLPSKNGSGQGGSGKKPLSEKAKALGEEVRKNAARAKQTKYDPITKTTIVISEGTDHV